MTIRRSMFVFITLFAVAAPAVAWADDYVGTTTTTATTSTTRPTTTTTSARSTTTVIEGVSITTGSGSGTTPSSVLGSNVTRPSVLGDVTTRPQAVGGLALTGTDILGITAFAAALLAAGLGLVIRARRRPVA